MPPKKQCKFKGKQYKVVNHDSEICSELWGGRGMGVFQWESEYFFDDESVEDILLLIIEWGRD